MSGRVEYPFPIHLHSVNKKKKTSNRERSKCNSISKMLYPISTLTTFGWGKDRRIFVKWKNYLNNEGRWKRNAALNCSLLKTIALNDSFSVGIWPPSIKWIARPFGMQKRSLNSRLERSSIGFSEWVRSTHSLGRPPFLPLPAALVEATPLALTCWSKWAE